MTFNLDSNEIKIQPEDRGIRLTSSVGDSQLLSNVTIDETEEIVAKNYYIVKEHYKQIIGNKILETDLQKISIKIVLRFFYMYQLWRTMYAKEKKRDLTFLQKDFNNLSTADTIVSYFKTTYPNSYTDKSETMLDMTADEFKEFEKSRKAFFDLC
jgi:hypothetical protein